MFYILTDFAYETHPSASHEKELQNRQVSEHRFSGSDSSHISTQFPLKQSVMLLPIVYKERENACFCIPKLG